MKIKIYNLTGQLLFEASSAKRAFEKFIFPSLPVKYRSFQRMENSNNIVMLTKEDITNLVGWEPRSQETIDDYWARYRKTIRDEAAKLGIS